MADVFLHSFNTLSHGFIGYVIPFLFVLTIVVFFHELGHFLVARWAGVKVLTFSLGFGPELVGFNDRHGTRWKISAVPLGGYVKFFGDDSEASTPSSEALANMTEEERAGSFHHKKVGPRAAIVAAGPVANFVLAIVIFTCLFTFFGKPNTSARVDKVEVGSAAEAAGFQVGDVVTAIDGDTIENFTDMQRIVSVRAGEHLTFTIKRGDSTLQLHGTPELKEVKDLFGNVAQDRRARDHPRYLAGRGHDREGRSRDRALARRQGDLVRDRPDAFLYRKRFHRPGQRRSGWRSDPNRADFRSGRDHRVAALLHLAAVLSISIGLLNLFPVPLLDGGHLLFYAAEVLRGRPLSDRSQEYGFRVGFVLVLMLMVFAFYNDFHQVPWLKSLFG